MRVGMMGLGKLGLEVSRAIASRGHEVLGYDIDPEARRRAESMGVRQTSSVYKMSQVVDLVFVAVQTPHAAQFEGITRLPRERRDFDYSYLAGAVSLLAECSEGANHPIVSIVSTVLPGTLERDIKPLMRSLPLVYNPSFIAQGTVESDFLHPEFVLIGVDDPQAADTLQSFYEQTVEPGTPIYKTSVKNAELIKVAYNTFIGLKIVFANTLMEICHKTGCDVDEVTDALKMATKRLISPAYLTAGMGDGGACHPRDNIAMSWMARQLNLSYDLFESVMLCREKQAEYLADLMMKYTEEYYRDEFGSWERTLVIVGTSYKPGVLIETGSPARLVENILKGRGVQVAINQWHPTNPQVFLVGCKEPMYAEQVRWPRGSVVIDPFRYVPDQKGVTVIRVGQAVDERVPSVV